MRQLSFWTASKKSSDVHLYRGHARGAMSMESVGCVTKSRPEVHVSVLGASAMHRKRVGDALRRDCTDGGTAGDVRLRPSSSLRSERYLTGTFARIRQIFIIYYLQFIFYAFGHGTLQNSFDMDGPLWTV